MVIQTDGLHIKLHVLKKGRDFHEQEHTDLCTGYTHTFQLKLENKKCNLHTQI